MPIFGDPQNFLKQASSKNNDMSSLTNDNQQTSMNSSSTQAVSSQQTTPDDQTSNNAELQGALNKDMQTGEGTMQDKSGIANSSNIKASSKQEFVHAGNEDMTSTSSETVEVEEQGMMAKWIKKKVMGGTEQDTQQKEQGQYTTEANPETSLPEGTNADLAYNQPGSPKMPKAPEPPPHSSNIPKGAKIGNIPTTKLPPAPKMPRSSMPKMSMPKMPRPRF